MKKNRCSLIVAFGILVLVMVAIFSGCGAKQNSTAAAETTISIESESTSTKVPETTVKEETTTPERTTVEEATAVVSRTIPSDSTFSITFIDVGQGDASLVECDGHYMLIDGGNKSCSSKIYAILDSLGVDHLDIIVGTHPDADHIGGLSGALNKATADLVLCTTETHDTETFEDFAKYASLNGNGIKVPTVGDTYNLGYSKIKILAVNSIQDDSNNSSIVLKITYGETSYLFVGDLEQDGEQVVLNSKDASELKSTLLKVSHHGSNNGTSSDFLKKVKPSYAVISVGRDNSYGFPEEELLSRLNETGAKILRTDIQGNIVCTSDGKTVSVSVEKNADADTLEPQTTTAETQVTDAVVPGATEEGYVCTYMLNKNTKKFHLMGCSKIKAMSEKNKWEYTATKEEIIAMGFTPCSVCNP